MIASSAKTEQCILTAGNPPKASTTALFVTCNASSTVFPMIISVEIEDSNLAKRYVARIIKNVTVKESPKWLKERVESIGIRSINNIVDASNFIMMELNQPNHTFDLDKIEGGKIVVRAGHENEKLVTLDEQERELNSEDIVISDGVKAVALGGVMGGQNSDTPS